jgi:hypothetical protein
MRKYCTKYSPLILSQAVRSGFPSSESYRDKSLFPLPIAHHGVRVKAKHQKVILLKMPNLGYQVTWPPKKSFLPSQQYLSATQPSSNKETPSLSRVSVTKTNSLGASRLLHTAQRLL